MAVSTADAGLLIAYATAPMQTASDIGTQPCSSWTDTPRALFDSAKIPVTQVKREAEARQTEAAKQAADHQQQHEVGHQPTQIHRDIAKDIKTLRKQIVEMVVDVLNPGTSPSREIPCGRLRFAAVIDVPM